MLGSPATKKSPSKRPRRNELLGQKSSGGGERKRYAITEQEGERKRSRDCRNGSGGMGGGDGNIARGEPAGQIKLNCTLSFNCT